MDTPKVAMFQPVGPVFSSRRSPPSNDRRFALAFALPLIWRGWEHRVEAFASKFGNVVKPWQQKV